MAQNSGELAQDIDVLREDMNKLRHDMGEMLSRMSEDANTRMIEVRDKAKDAGKRAITQTEDTIRDRPLSSVLVLFLVGLLFGWLLDRKLSA